MIDYLWEQVITNGMPPLGDLSRERRDGLELLDSAIKDCLEEWYLNQGHLCAHSIVRLSNYSHELTCEMRRFNGEVPGYFEDLKDRCQRVLHWVRGREARQAIVGTTTRSLV